MFYLALNIVFASVFTLLIKWVGNRKREDIVTVGAINYVVAALLVVPGFLTNELELISVHAVATGGAMGACYFVTYFFVVHAIARIGASAATVIGGLSVLLPIVCGAVIWDETPNAYQCVGIALSIIALSLIGRHGGAQTAGRAWTTPVILILFFLLAGFARLAQEAFKHGSDADQRPTFLFAAFVITAVPSLAILISRKFQFSLRECVFGCAMGSANYLQLHFTMKALQDLPGFVVFPIASAGCLILTAIVATQLLDERLSRKTHVGIVLASIALVLLNWLPDS
jgi:drug/metabolite transporter (DMT)-like permease